MLLCFIVLGKYIFCGNYLNKTTQMQFDEYYLELSVFANALFVYIFYYIFLCEYIIYL